MYGAPGAPGYVPPSGSTAKTLILVGLILQLVFALVFLFALGFAAIFIGGVTGTFPIFALIYIVFGVVGFIVLFLIYVFSYKPTREGRYEEARTPTLVFAILSLITFSLISGILYLIGYIKLGDAVRERQSPPPGYGYPPPGMGAPIGAPPPGYAVPPPQAPAAPPAAQPMPAATPAAAPSAAPICPRCNRPGTWIPQYSRYYCYSCGQYL